MKCEEFIRLIDAYIDGELDKKTVSDMLSHANECENCARELRMAEMLRNTLGGIDDDIVPPLAAQAAWRSAIKTESRKKRMSRIYKICASAAAAVVLMVGLYAGLDAFDMNGSKQQTVAHGAADAGFVFVATDGNGEAEETAARTLSIAQEDEVAGSTANVTLTAADPDAACESIISMSDEFFGYTEMQSDETELCLTAYIPAESVDQFVDSLSLVGEITGYQFYEGESANVAITIIINTAE